MKFSFTFPTIILFILSALVGWNVTTFVKDLSAKQRLRQERPFFFSGHKFLGINELLKNSTHIGYYTDQSLDAKNNPNAQGALAQFQQAQFSLAPLILDLNNTNHQYIILNCSTPQIAIQKLKELKAIPLKVNSYRIILAQRKLS